MKKSTVFLGLLIPVIAACVSTNVDVPRDHPANPSAPVAQVASTPSLVTTAAIAEGAAPAAHEHGHGHGHDREAPPPSASAATAAVPSAAAPAPPTKQADKPAAEVWTCPMHVNVAKNGPGQCPICGMNLVKRGPGKGNQ